MKASSYATSHAEIRQILLNPSARALVTLLSLDLQPTQLLQFWPQGLNLSLGQFLLFLDQKKLLKANSSPLLHHFFDIVHHT